MSSTAASSERMYAAAPPMRVWPCRRATSDTRYSSGWGTGVRLDRRTVSMTSAAVQPASRARRTDSGVKR